jgi:hypothetical protein
MINKKVSEKIINIENRVEVLDVKISQRPTFKSLISMGLISLSILMGGMYFILGNLLSSQTDKIFAQTENTILLAFDKMDKRNSIEWAEKEETIIEKILAKLAPKALK